MHIGYLITERDTSSRGIGQEHLSRGSGKFSILANIFRCAKNHLIM